MSDISEKAIHIAAQCWCDPETSDIVMHEKLAMAFAKRYDQLVKAHNEMVDLNKAFQDVCKKSEIEMKAQMDLIETMAEALEWYASFEMSRSMQKRLLHSDKSWQKAEDALQEYRKWKDGE